MRGKESGPFDVSKPHTRDLLQTLTFATGERALDFEPERSGWEMGHAPLGR